MKLDRNISPTYRGKYALLLLRRWSELEQSLRHGELVEIENALSTLEAHGMIRWGNKTNEDFFVLMLRDTFAWPALLAYTNAVLDWVRNNTPFEIMAKMLDRQPLTEAEAFGWKRFTTLSRELKKYAQEIEGLMAKSLTMPQKLPD